MTETLSVVIPVYRGQDTIKTVVEEILALFPVPDAGAGEPEVSEESGTLSLTEVLLVHDGAVDDSASVLQELEEHHPRVKAVWLSRNYGQHAATLAGCASTVGDWICTLDEDGLHDPEAIAVMHQTALREGASVVYAQPRTHSHSLWRRTTSRGSKVVAERLLGVKSATDFASFRLLDGYGTRALAAYCGYDVYLDVALTWVFSRITSIQTDYRVELRGGESGYSLHSLLSHFRRLAITAGPRPLRLAAGLGLAMALVGILGSLIVVAFRLAGTIEVPGWTSVVAGASAFFGTVLVVLGVIAEYLSAVLSAVSGRPPYLIQGRPPRRPTGGP